MDLLSHIQDHIRARRMSPTRFGIAALGDPKFVFNLQQGRQPRDRTVKRILDFIARSSGEGGHA